MPGRGRAAAPAAWPRRTAASRVLCGMIVFTSSPHASPRMGGEVMSELPGRPDRGSLDAPDERWSFGGATTIETAEGVLLPEALVIGPRQAALHARWRRG